MRYPRAHVAAAALVTVLAARCGSHTPVLVLVENVPNPKGSAAGQCLSPRLVPDASGHVACAVVEAKNVETCSCERSLDRVKVSAQDQPIIAVAISDRGLEEPEFSCFCEIPQLTGAQLEACQHDTSPMPEVEGKGVDGWCYVDADTAPPTGDPALVASCLPDARRSLRFVGQGAPLRGAMVFLGCFDSGG